MRGRSLINAFILAAFPRTRLTRRDVAWAWRGTSKSYRAIEKISLNRYALCGNSCVMHPPSARVRRANIGVALPHFGCRLRLPPSRIGRRKWNLFILEIRYGCGERGTLRGSCTKKSIRNRIHRSISSRGERGVLARRMRIIHDILKSHTES